MKITTESILRWLWRTINAPIRGVGAQTAADMELLQIPPHLATRVDPGTVSIMAETARRGIPSVTEQITISRIMGALSPKYGDFREHTAAIRKTWKILDALQDTGWCPPYAAPWMGDPFVKIKTEAQRAEEAEAALREMSEALKEIHELGHSCMDESEYSFKYKEPIADLKHDDLFNIYDDGFSLAMGRMAGIAKRGMGDA